MLNSFPPVVGKNLPDCPSLMLRFALLTQYQKSYDTKHSLYLETMLMQCYGNVAMLKNRAKYVDNQRTTKAMLHI